MDWAELTPGTARSEIGRRSSWYLEHLCMDLRHTGPKYVDGFIDCVHGTDGQQEPVLIITVEKACSVTFDGPPFRQYEDVEVLWKTRGSPYAF